MTVPVQPELSRIDPVILPEWNDKGVQAAVLRLDLIHPVISGNKWFKLRFYIRHALDSGQQKIVTFGGAWSNHIVATAAACKEAGIKCAGIIRGEEPATWSSTLSTARDLGMELHFISRSDYRNKKIPDQVLEEKPLVVPEGGYGPEGEAGAATISEYFDSADSTHICCAVGTGTMMAGLIRSSPDLHVTGINVVKNAGAEVSVRNLLVDIDPEFEIIHNYVFGGYAKYNANLITFMNSFFTRTGIPSDFVYTGKLFYGVDHLVRQGYFPVGSKILLIHSGGLQGNSSLEKGTLIW